MADILLDGLPVLDLLEIAPSTSVVAQITRRDQSSISRIYRQVSGRLGLEFCKHHDGRYRARSNQALLEGLRLSSQWLRLQGSPAEPRWLACGLASLATPTHAPALPPPFSERCSTPQRLQGLIKGRVLDLAVLTRPADPAASAPELLDVPLLRHPGGIDLIVLRSDQQQQPALQELIAAIRLHYRQHLEQHPDLEWLG